MKKLLKWTGITLVGLIVLIALFSKPGSDSLKQGMEEGRAQTSDKAAVEVKEESPAQPADKVAVKVEEKASTPLERIKTIVADVTNGTVTPDLFSGDEFATESNAPYQVVVNYPFQHSITSCDAAKRVSYDLIEALYKDQIARGAVQRVLVSIPNYLRTSLGATDGVPMVEKGSFTGPTNYWKVMSGVDFSTEKEEGNMVDRTWGVIFADCK